jgi:hypothetical protein
MAFSVLIELAAPNNDWQTLNKDIKPIGEEVIEFFPIPNSSSLGKNHLGMSVLLNGSSQSARIEAFKNCINYFIDKGCRVFELYSSKEFLSENVTELTTKFFG